MILPEGFDEHLPPDEQVEQLIASGLYDRDRAERTVRLLRRESGPPID